MAKKEPSLGEFMGFVKKQFELQQSLLEKTAFDIRDLRQGQLMHDKQLDEIQQTLRGLSHAIDSDSVKVIDHERRIHRLEFKAK